MPVVCSIGCSDPWNAAGTGLDIRALAACGARTVSVLAGITAQDREGLHQAAPVAPGLIAAQLRALSEAGIEAYRIGALLDVASVEVVAAHLAETSVPAVYDPVFGASAGGSFAGDAVVAAIRSRLLPRVALVTPNLAEAARLCARPALTSVDDMEHAARGLLDFGARAALVTGDVLVDDQGLRRYEATRLSGELRGTGCLLACGIAAELARGAALREAITAGRNVVRQRFADAVNVGGMRLAY